MGDHIYADIIKSKKRHAWRNLLIIPELEHELIAWESNKKLYNHLLNLEYMKAEAFRNLDSQSTTPPVCYFFFYIIFLLFYYFFIYFLLFFNYFYLFFFLLLFNFFKKRLFFKFYIIFIYFFYIFIKKN